MRDENLEVAEREVAEFFGSLTPEEFTLRVEPAWTPAEHLAHLNIAVSAVARGFGLPRLLLRLRFGRAKHATRSYDEVREAYRARLAAGGKATGQYVPPREELEGEQRSVRQTELLARWKRVNARLRTALETWTDKDLDRIQLPHPLLGKLTAREMLRWTAYHNRHHIAGAKSRLPIRG